MITWALGIAVLLAQLTAPGNSLPQIMSADFSEPARVQAGRKSEVTVSFDLLDGYAINRTPPISLKLTAVPGISLEKTEFTSSPDDPKSKDEYYVDLPSLKVPVVASRAGRYEIPAQLVYFFCSKSDGFCSRQSFNIKIPVEAR